MPLEFILLILQFVESFLNADCILGPMVDTIVDGNDTAPLLPSSAAGLLVPSEKQ